MHLLPTYFDTRVWRRRSILALAGILCVLTMALLALQLFAASAVGRNFLEARLEASPIAGQHIVIDGLEGNLLGQFRIGRLELSDAEGAWLNAEQVTVQWSPMSLLSGHAKFALLDVMHLRVLRAPVLPAPDGNASTTGRRIRRLSLQQLNVPHLNLAAPLLQSPQNFALSGHTDATRETGHLTLNLAPFEDTGDSVQAALDWSETLPLSGKLIAEGEVGGLLDKLMSPVNPGKLQLALTGRGTPEDWQIDASISLGGTQDVLLEATGKGDTTTLSGRVNIAAFQALLPISYRVGPTLDLSLDHVAGAPLSAKIVSDVLVAEATAIFSGTGTLIETASPSTLDAIQFSITGKGSENSIAISDFQVASISVDGGLMRSGTDWSLDAKLISNAAGFSGYTANNITGTVSAMILGGEDQIATQAQIDVAGAQYDNTTLQTYLGPRASFKIAAQIDRDFSAIAVDTLSATVTAGVVTATGETQTDLSALALEGSFTPSPSHLPFDATRLDWRLSRTDGQALAIQMRGAVQSRAQLPAHFAPWTDGSVQFSVMGEYNLDTGTIALSDIKAQSTGLHLSGALDYDASGLRADLIANAVSAAFPEASFGNTVLELDVSGPLSAIAVDLNIEPTDVILYDAPAQINSAKLSGNFSDTGFLGALAIGAVWRDDVWELTAAPNIDSSLWALGNISANLGGFSLIGDVSGDGADFNKAKISFELAGRTSLLPGNPTVNGSARLDNGTADLDLTLREASHSGVLLETAHLSGRGTKAAFAGEVRVVGSLSHTKLPQAFEASIPIELDVESRILTLAPDGRIANLPISTSRPLTIKFTDDALGIDGALDLLDGSIDVSARTAPDETRLDLVVMDMSVNPLAEMLGLPELTGTLQASAQLSDIGDQVSGTARLDIPNLDREGRDGPPLVIQLAAILDDGLGEVTGAVTSSTGELDLRLLSSLPVAALLPPSHAATKTSASVTGGGSVSELWSLLDFPDMNLDGNFALEASLIERDGRIEPRAKLNIANGIFEDSASGLYLAGITLKTDLMTDQVSVSEFSANGSTSGSLSGRGVYRFGGNSDLAITLDRLNALRRDDITATISGDLSLKQMEGGAEVSGDLIFDRVEIDLDQLPQSQYTTLDVQFSAEPNHNNNSADIRFLPIGLNVRLRADDNVFVSNKALTSEWRIDAMATGSISTPLLFGEAEIVRGDVNLVGRNFAFRDSTIQLSGDPLDAQLDIRADRVLDTLTAQIVLTGTADNPTFKLQSVPNLPDDEILSRVLFGRSAVQLTLFQTAQLAAAVASFSGKRALDPVGAVQDVLGVDRLDFGISETGEVSVGAGKYVAKDVYVELRTDVRGDTGLAIEWTPVENIEVTTEVDGNRAAEFGIRWRRDFNIGSQLAQVPVDDGGENSPPDDRE